MAQVGLESRTKSASFQNQSQKQSKKTNSTLIFRWHWCFCPCLCVCHTCVSPCCGATQLPLKTSLHIYLILVWNLVVACFSRLPAWEPLSPDDAFSSDASVPYNGTAVALTDQETCEWNVKSRRFRCWKHSLAFDQSFICKRFVFL